MSAPLEHWVDAAIGETREALVKDGRPIALRVMRASDEDARARWGEVYRACVREVDARRRGAFLDLGLSEDHGFLPTPQTRRADLYVGQCIAVSVSREAARGKSPVVALHPGAIPEGEPRRIAQPECDLDLMEAKPAPADTREKLDAAIEAALARAAPVPGGGVLTIEPTQALTAVDVDAGARGGSPDPERFAFDLNVAAARETAGQVRLRNLGGVIAIDFVSMHSRNLRAELQRVVRAAFEDDPWSVQHGGLSRFGVYELARAQLRTPLHEQMCDPDGRLSTESLALMALRAIEREARAQGGRQIACTVSQEVMGWLEGARLDWRAALSGRIGPRWTLEAGQGPRDKIDARAL